MPIIIYSSLFRDALLVSALAAGFATYAQSAPLGGLDLEPSPISNTKLTWPDLSRGLDGHGRNTLKDLPITFEDDSVPSTEFEKRAVAPAAGVERQARGDYDFETDGVWVYGGEAEYDWANPKDYKVEQAGAGAERETWAAQIKATAALRARLGYKIGHTVIYAAAGPAVLSYGSASASRTGRASLSESKFHWGWSAAFGFEHEMSDQWEWNIAYRHANFSALDPSAVSSEGDGLETHEVLIGLAASF